MDAKPNRYTGEAWCAGSSRPTHVYSWAGFLGSRFRGNDDFRARELSDSEQLRPHVYPSSPELSLRARRGNLFTEGRFLGR